MQRLPSGAFDGLGGLYELNLSGTSLRSLPSGAFEGLDSLTRLYLNDTRLDSLPGGVFADLARLITLELSDNRLLQTSDWPVRPFDGLDSLQILRLANTGYEGRGIQFVNTDRFEDFFVGLASLRVLDVRPSTPLLSAPRSFLPLTSLETYNGRPYTRPADPPRNLTATMSDVAESWMVDERVIDGFIDTGRISLGRPVLIPNVVKTGRKTGFCKTVSLNWAAPTGVSGITGYQILRTHFGHPVVSSRNPNTDYSRYAYDIATVGANTTSYVHSPLRPGASGHKFTYYVVAITADGDGFPARVKVEADILIPWDSKGSRTTGPDVLPCPIMN